MANHKNDEYYRTEKSQNSGCYKTANVKKQRNYKTAKNNKKNLLATQRQWFALQKSTLSTHTKYIHLIFE